MQRDALDVERREELVGEVEAGRRRGRRTRLPRVHGLVPRRIVERLGDVRRERGLARRLALEPHQPTTLADVLEQLDRPVALTRVQPARGPREPFPQTVLVEALEQQHLAARLLDRDACRHDSRVVHDRERVAEHVR